MLIDNRVAEIETRTRRPSVEANGGTIRSR